MTDSRPLRILQICGRVPVPPLDGGRIAMWNLARGLHRGGAHVDIFALNTSRHEVDATTLLNLELPIATANIDTTLRPLAALRNLFSSESYHVSRFRSAHVASALERQLDREYDVIQVESIYLAEYLPLMRRLSKAKVVLRALNLDYEVWQRVAAQTSGLKKRYLQIQTSRLRRYEIAALNRFDAIVPITERDAQSMKAAGCTRPMHIAPFGVFADEYRPHTTPQQPTVFHIGSLDWSPNQDAVRWLLSEIWPRVVARKPEARLVLAGSAPPQSIVRLANARGVELLQNVPDAHRFIDEHRVMVVPVRAGGGMRVKIIEGMALAKSIVTTSIGAEGIEGTPGEHLLVADDAAAFSDAVVSLLQNRERAAALGAQARQLVETKYDAATIAASLLEFYRRPVAADEHRQPQPR